MKYNLVENSRTMAEDSNTGHAASVGDAKEQIVDDQDLSTPSINSNDPAKEVKMPTKVNIWKISWLCSR